MTTINISLPDKLKTKAQTLVDSGYYSSFSDMVRDALRRLVQKDKYTLWADDGMEDLKKGRATVLKNKKEIKKYFDNLKELKVTQQVNGTLKL